MKALSEFKKSFFISLWFMLLTFPIMVIRVNTIEKVIEWRWRNMALVGIGSFLLSFVWRLLLNRKERGRKLADEKNAEPRAIGQAPLRGVPDLPSGPNCRGPLRDRLSLPLFQLPDEIMTTALIYVMLGLGLNIVVGLAGLLDLGYVAFYAVGAYSYALLNHHFGLGFWAALPVGALLGALFGILLGFPVLRLRGDYLAIVTLGFGEIIRLILENWNAFSFGPSGISNIPRPGFFGIDLSLHEATIYLYFLMIALCLFTIFVVNRLQNSRIGRAWIALREDEVACEAMGIDKTRTKLTAFALGATWAGMVGVIFAAKTTFINPGELHLHGVGDDPLHRRPGRNGLDHGRDPRGLPSDPDARVSPGLQRLPDAPFRNDDGPDDGLPPPGDRDEHPAGLPVRRKGKGRRAGAGVIWTVSLP